MGGNILCDGCISSLCCCRICIWQSIYRCRGGCHWLQLRPLWHPYLPELPLRVNGVQAFGWRKLHLPFFFPLKPNGHLPFFNCGQISLTISVPFFCGRFILLGKDVSAAGCCGVDLGSWGEGRVGGTAIDGVGALGG